MKTKENMKKGIKKDIKNCANYKFYKSNPSGISLIVLVITIIVIIILATAIIVTLLGNNPISEANKARFESDRDNMQSIFTNTVAKVMAEKNCTMNIKASSLNTITSGVSSTTGDANYTLNDGNNTSGKIVFDNSENKENEYYTGKQLPIYKSGKTTWYVDEEGIISLRVGDETYGDGKIVNGIKITPSIIPSEEYIKEKAKVRIEVVYEDELQNILFNNETITEFEKQDSIYVVEREVTKNGTYEIIANGENGATSKTNVVVNVIDELNGNIQINSTVTPSSDYVKVGIGIEITFNGEIESIIINGENVALPSKNGGKYVLSKEVLENGEYKIEVKGKDGTTNKAVVKVTQITENMEIWNRADMETFRDKVNSGRTFEGKIVNVMADFNLGNTSNNWVPVANYAVNENLTFKGTFDGNNKIISGLYISTTNDYQGLFGVNNGEIRNIKINGNITKGGSWLGGIVGWNKGNILNCHNSININADGAQIGGIVGYNEGSIKKCSNLADIKGFGDVGGIAGRNLSNINSCFNKKSVIATQVTSGGIVGYHITGTIYNSYNIGNINAPNNIGGISGASGRSGYSTAYIYNCYSIGNITGNLNVGNIIGLSNANEGSSQDINCYTTNATVTRLNSGTYSENSWKADKVPNINKGYPILKWQ